MYLSTYLWLTFCNKCPTYHSLDIFVCPVNGSDITYRGSTLLDNVMSHICMCFTFYFMYPQVPFFSWLVLQHFSTTSLGHTLSYHSAKDKDPIASNFSYLWTCLAHTFLHLNTYLFGGFED